MKCSVRIVLLWLMCLACPCVSTGLSNDAPTFSDSALEFFEKDVRPLLAARCFECHSAERGSPKGGLSLDSRAGLLTGGDTGPAVVLDQPAESLLVSSINYGDLYQMPPKSKLPPEEIAILTRWVEMGLPWPHETTSGAGAVKPLDVAERKAAHWCWQPIGIVTPPETGSSNWPVTAADRFILAGLQARGLSPAPAAEKRTLLRRIYFDLVGLPPSPDEVEQFVHDDRPNAFEIVVDRLLNSVHFGERWGRHWLDLARYAETRGHEFEPVIPNAWQYRDYVIRALNQDVPYDRFLTEQVAGDLLEPRWRSLSKTNRKTDELPINEAILGTAFWFLGEEVHSPVDIRKDETDRMDNRLDVLTKSFLGLTVACARCHDHKFDAISQKDYYALAGYALSGSYRQVRVDTAEQHRQIAGQLEEQRTQARQEIALSLVTLAKSVLDQLDRYLLSAMQALHEGFTSKLAVGEDPTKLPDFELVRRVATESQLDPSLLARWCAELVVAKEDQRHPLHELIAREPASQGTATSLTPSESASVGMGPGEPAVPGLVVDFGDPNIKSAPQDGVSFGVRPRPRGQLVNPSPQTSPFSVDTVGGWSRDLFWKDIKLSAGTEVDSGTLGAWQPYGRMVRSPEFTLQKRNAWYLIKGSVRAYASVNSHLIVVGPLHGGMLREYKHADDEWHWVSHDLSLYTGHRMHVEFSPADDGPARIAMVVQTDEAPKLPEPVFFSQDVLRTVGSPLPERVAAYAAEFRAAVTSLLKEGNASPNDGSNTASATIDPSVRAQLANWFVTHLSLFTTKRSHFMHWSSNEAELAKRVQWESSLAPAMLEGNGVDELLLVRGNSNSPKEPVSRRFLEAFQQSGPDVASPVPTSGSGRLELAREILRSPLASRVAVNRIWHHLFGRGIVPSVDNLGVLGLPPSHPELLDYLANEFIQSGWSTKAMIRSLVLSRTYQMSSRPTEADSLDPNNEFWHRMPIKRLQGEAIRDSLLAVSGRLDPAMFGPSVPIHLTEFMQGRGRPGVSGPLDGNSRRSIYISVRRNFLSPMMLAFDTPSPFSTVGRRTVSNVPAQALILMNDPFVIEQAQHWADRLLTDAAATTPQRLNQLYLMAFARTPSEAELAEAMAFLDAQGESQPENKRMAWSNLCHVMFNVKEFVYIE